METEVAALEVEVLLNNKKVFASIYYPYQKKVTFRDIRSIVETAMLEAYVSFGTVKIRATEIKEEKPNVTYDDDGNIHVTLGDTSNPVTVSKTFKAVYCRFKTIYSSADFLQYKFLSTRKSALMSRNSQTVLANYTKANAQGTNYAVIYYTDNANPDKVLKVDYDLDSVQASTECIVLENLSHLYFKYLVDYVKNTNCTVLGVEYNIGMREFNIFFTDEEPTDTFTFLNAFNVEETAFLYGATTVKTEVERSEAVCGQQTQFYDETVKIKHEVETAPLPYEEAIWLNEMLTSKLVRRPLINGSLVEVLISDISSEVSNGDTELIRLKFSWRYADGNEWV